jgi:hypothetical protein
MYKIQHGEHFYLGSTICSLSHRLGQHKTEKRESKFYTHMRGLWNEATITLIENYPCSTRRELLDREDVLIRQSLGDPFCLNTQGAKRDEEARKEQASIHKKELYLENKDAIDKRNKEAYWKNAERRRQHQRERVAQQKFEAGEVYVERPLRGSYKKKTD